MKQKIKFIAAASALTLLTACGGGGDDPGASDAVGAGAGGSTATSQFAGTWKALDIGCDDDGEVKLVGANNARSPSYSAVSPITVTTTATGLRLTGEQQIFDNPTCAGAPRATHRITTNLVFDGKRVVDGKTVDLYTFRDEPINSGLRAGGTITLNGVVYPGDYFTRTYQEKGLSYLDGNQWFLSGDVDYPAKLDATPTLRRL